MNRIMLTGHLVADLERSVTNGGTVVAKGRLAVPGGGDKLGEKPRDNPGFYNIESYGAGAEAALRYLGKGSLVEVDGRLQHSTWKDRDSDANRQSYTVVGNIGFLAPGKDDTGREQKQEAGAQAEADAEADIAVPPPVSLRPSPAPVMSASAGMER